MKGCRISGWANRVSEICNANGNELYKVAALHWSKPTVWPKADHIPTFDTDQPFVYALIRDHGKATIMDRIVVVK